ncbi:MAG: polysaccharide deacetylase family protein [Novosphingobium sp.]
MLLLASGTAHAEKRIALTFDDVPRQRGAWFTPDERTRRLIAQLRAVRAPQAAFFIVPGQLVDNDDGIGGARRISAYARAGNVIANHTYSHPRLSDMTADAFLAEIDAAGRWLKGRTGYRPWFRFPTLDEGGKDKAKRDAVRAGLAARGLRNAYVTAGSSDWNLEALTRDAVKAGKRVDRAALRQLYVTWHVEAADQADGLMQQAIGRQPAQVLLLHETDLAALYLADLVRALRRDGWTIISADEAYADPLRTAMPDTPAAQGTLTEMLAWEKGLPAPRWYKYNDVALAAGVFREKVLGERPQQ